MSRELAEKIANAVLYEGYMLYPYRRSAIKNRQRWTFGILYPPAYREVGSGTERSGMHSECLLQGNGDATVRIQIRFLHLMAGQVARLVSERFEPVPSSALDDDRIESRDEGVERSVEFNLESLRNLSQRFDFRFPGEQQTEPLRDRADNVIGSVSRTQHEVSGTVFASSEPIADGVVKLTIDVFNDTSLPSDALDRNAALLRSLLSAHTILTVTGGEFVSLLDPPEDLRAAVNACKNIGNFPVLVGTQDERDLLLCSPILLYDYPQIAPESAGDFFDATEMDEMLTLRIMTLTEQEKDEMRLAGDHVRGLLQRTEETAREQLARTHGAIRSLRPVGEQ